MVTEEPEITESSSKKWCTALQSPERMVRQTCLKQMLEYFEKPQKDNVESLYDEIYLHLLKTYSDKFEMCRSLAVSVVSAALKQLPRNSRYLEYLAEIIAKRLAQAEILEESEELRLQLVTQVKDLVEKFKSKDGDDPILKAFNDIVDILVKTLRDPFPAVQKESCEVVLLLAKSTPSFHYRAEVLVKPTSLMLYHRYSANRIIAIETLSIIAFHILTNDECIGFIIMNISKLLMDSVPNVRRECGLAGVRLGLELRDRYSHFSKILPLILCCLVDDIEFVQEEILKGWLKVGEQYYNENEEEMKQYALTDLVPENYPTDLKRPTLGCRTLVQRNLRVVNVILHEMEEFKEEIRLHSAKLLRQVVIHSEKMFATQLVDSYAVLAKTCNDPEKIVAAEAMIIALYLGALLEYKAWGKHAREELEKHPNLGNLKCFTAMYTAAGSEKLIDLNEITKVLADAAICHNMDEEYQKQLLELCNVLTEGLLCSQNDSNVTDANTERNLYCIVMKVKAFAGNDETLTIGSEIINKLATLTYASEFNLHQRHLENLLSQIEGLDIETQELSEPVILLAGIIQLCGLNTSNIELIQSKLQAALKIACADSRVTLFAAIAEAMLAWKQYDDGNDVLQLIKGFVKEIILPYLVWSAGRSAETVRTMATASLCATSQGVAKEIAAELIGNLTTQLLPLIEDQAIKTRYNALRTLCNAGRIENGKLKPLIFMVLSRLDDPSADIRVMAAQLLGELKPETKENWTEVVEQIVERMLLHLECPEQKLKEQLVASLKVIKEDFPAVYQKHFDAIPAKHNLKELLL